MADEQDGLTINPLARLAALFQPPCPPSVTKLRAAMDDLDPVSRSLRARLDRPIESVRISPPPRE